MDKIFFDRFQMSTAKYLHNYTLYTTYKPTKNKRSKNWTIISIGNF